MIFGLVSEASIFGAGGSFFGVPKVFAPFVMLILTELMVPNSSLMGHLSGIVIGYLVGLGLFDWIDTYLLVCSLIW